MSPEQFHDALNYLDDDLIAQTDDLRQGRRVLHRKPHVLHWLVPAACLVLVLGIGSGLLPVWETGNGAPMEHGGASNQEFPEYMLQDFLNASSDSSRQESVGCAWVRHTCFSLSLMVPETWTCDQEELDDGSYHMVIRPPHEEGAIRVCYEPGFAVCGTGLTTEGTIIAGMDASVGSYDGSHMWSFITFSGAGEGYVVLNDGASAWWGDHGETALQILESIEISEKG